MEDTFLVGATMIHVIKNDNTNRSEVTDKSEARVHFLQGHISYKIPCAHSEHSDQRAHLRSLICFSGHSVDSKVSKSSSDELLTLVLLNKLRCHSHF